MAANSGAFIIATQAKCDCRVVNSRGSLFEETVTVLLSQHAFCLVLGWLMADPEGENRDVHPEMINKATLKIPK